MSQVFFRPKLPVMWEEKKRALVLRHSRYEKGEKLARVFEQRFHKRSHDKVQSYNLDLLEKGLEATSWLIHHYGGDKAPRQPPDIAPEFESEIQDLLKAAQEEKKTECHWKLGDPRRKLKRHHKALLAGMHQNEKTRDWTLEQKTKALIGFYPDIGTVGVETVRRFYKEEMRLSYNRCKKYKPPVDLNLEALAEMMIHIKGKIEEGYELLSLDETGFGGVCLKKYSWVKTGKFEAPEFTKQPNLTLLAMIGFEKIEAFQLLQGGNNEEWMRDFCNEFA